MPRTRKPTGRPPGRPYGSKNKATIDRDLRAQRELEARERRMQAGVERIAAAREAGEKMATEVIEDLMRLGMGLTASYQRMANLLPSPNGHIVGGPAELEEKFWRAANFTKECALGVANYQSPKLKATVQMTAPVRPDVPLLPAPEPGSTNVKYFLEHVYRQKMKTIG